MNLQKSIGRILFGITFFVFGILHIMNADKMGAYIPSFIPGGVFWVYLTGLGMIAAAVSFAMNKMVKLSGILLAAMLLIFILTIHIPHMFNPSMMQMTMGNLLKDFGLMAAAIYIASETFKPGHV